MLLHDIPKERKAIPESLAGLRCYLIETPTAKLRIHESDLRVEVDYSSSGNWRSFPPHNIPGWLTTYPNEGKPWPWDRIEFVP